jgi:hypothetical protein
MDSNMKESGVLVQRLVAVNS